MPRLAANTGCFSISPIHQNVITLWDLRCANKIICYDFDTTNLLLLSSDQSSSSLSLSSFSSSSSFFVLPDSSHTHSLSLNLPSTDNSIPGGKYVHIMGGMVRMWRQIIKCRSYFYMLGRELRPTMPLCFWLTYLLHSRFSTFLRVTRLWWLGRRER